jgi:hypothetical protein
MAVPPRSGLACRPGIPTTWEQAGVEPERSAIRISRTQQATPDFAALNPGYMLSKHKRGNVDAFMQAVGEIAEVRAAFLLTGRWDVVIHVVNSPISRASPESKLRSSLRRETAARSALV